LRIEIFVVATKIKGLRTTETIEKAVSSILSCKEDLVKLFGGLTEIPYFNGYFMKRGNIEYDTGEIWLIYTDNPELVEDNRFKSILLEIKGTTKQMMQCYAVNNDLRKI